MIRRWLSAIVRYVRRPPATLPSEFCASLAEEIEFHLDEAAREQTAEGMPEPAARRAAAARFGDVGKVAADCYSLAAADQILCHRVHLLTTVGLVVGVIVLWTMNPDADSRVTDPPETSLARAPATGDIKLTGNITGQVVDERGVPIRGAHVLAVVKRWPPNGYRQQVYMTTSRSDGRFTIADVYLIGREYEVQIATVADGKTLQSSYFSSAGDALEPVVFRLEPTRPLVLRLEDHDGTTIQDAEVFPHRRIDSRGGDHVIYFQSADPIIQRTDRAGTVRLGGYRPGDRATVYVRPPDRPWQTRELKVPAGGQSVLLRLNDSSEGGPS